MRRFASVLLVFICIVLFVAVVGPGSPVAAAQLGGLVTLLGDVFDQVPHVAGCPIFSTNNIWNTPVILLPRSTHSDDYVSRIGASSSLHPNFGSDATNGIPINIVRPNTPQVAVSFTYGEESD